MFSDPFISPFFSIMGFMFPLVFLTILGVFIFTLIKTIKEWSYNNKQPIVPVNALIVSKRASVSHNHNGENHISSTSTTYYVTFEYSNGQRQEFRVSGSQYGLLAEGDLGILSFQGTRFIDFKRD